MAEKKLPHNHNEKLEEMYEHMMKIAEVQKQKAAEERKRKREAVA